MALQALQRGPIVTIFCIRNRALARVLLFLPSLGATLVALQLPAKLVCRPLWVVPRNKEFSMRKQMAVTAALASALLITGCANTGGMSDTTRRTATGAGVGALGGAAIGALTGHNAGTGALIGAGVGALGTYIWSQNLEKQKREMEAATQGTGVGVTQTADNQLKLDIPSDISFDTGRADIKGNFAPILDRFAEGLRNNPNAEVRIIGHTDSTGSDAINNPLSLQRAESTRNYLTARGVNGARIQVQGMGSHQPVASNATNEGRARNRRVEIFVGERAPQ
jgi:outer membrane protein OmpA-like peptidoglycan-associated protein